ncbi:M16 family metallopeptidase [Sorangium atrum]|uniref:Pitrilysin family protein n=1 Tax=Sorangium atrum TaxID=2995308 RepID=A0ABT5C8S9_9BACT|nr:pitrilysin family protein [Sorangium aterium]MDC0682841.1 pitrilysin family protein [Sorangium aterium]
MRAHHRSERTRLRALSSLSSALVAALGLTLPAYAAPPAAAPAQPAAAQPAAKPAPAAAAPVATKAQPAAAATSVSVAIPVEKYTLENGLEVVLHEDHRTPVVAVNVWYHVGSKDEPRGKNGFAHLFEHVMFQGSKHVGEDMFFKYLERAGASDRNGTTNTDRTNYFETVPANELALVLWLESDRMGWLLDHANEATFTSQRNVVKNERRQNYENAPYGLVPQFVRAAQFPESHPYHLLTIGTPEDLDAAQMDDVKAFFRTFYVPNNATLVVAGDIERGKAKELIQKYFGPIAKGAPPPVATKPDLGDLATEKRLDIEADVELPRVTISWVTPPSFAPGDAELDLVANVLASGKTSRLYKKLVYDLQIAQDVFAFQQSSQLASTFQITATLKKGKSPEQALKLIDAELDRLRKAPPTQDEHDRAQAKVLSELVFSMEQVTARANAINNYNQLTGDPGYFPKDVARYEKATAADLQKATADLLPQGRRVIALVTPKPGAPKAGRLVKQTGAAAPATAGTKPTAAAPAAAASAKPAVLAPAVAAPPAGAKPAAAPATDKPAAAPAIMKPAGDKPAVDKPAAGPAAPKGG